MLRTLTSLVGAQDESPNPVLVWGSEDWDAVRVPPHDFLVVPDVRDDGAGLDAPFAWLVHDDDIVGRVVY